MNVRCWLPSLLLGLGLLSGAVGGCAREEPRAVDPNEAIHLAAYQEDLLEVAFAAASAMPVYPHIKNRSRAQEVVVTACIELQQPEQARRYIEGIDNWRRAAGYADLAFYYAQRGGVAKVEPCLKQAAEAEVAFDPEGWRRERVRARMAAARTHLGPLSISEQEMTTAQWQAVVRARAMTCAAEAFDEQMAALEKLQAVDDFDVVRNALEAYAELYRRFYATSERRDAVEGKIKAAWSTLPVFVRIELLLDLTDAALDHADKDQALVLLAEARAIMDGARWRARFQIPLMAGMAERRFRAGDEAGALAELQAALALFEAKEATIVNIYRAGMLRPIAEAYHLLGDTATALDLYKRAVEAGMENPNSRPRVDDLVATCCSLALHAVEPDTALARRLHEVRDGLSDPW